MAFNLLIEMKIANMNHNNKSNHNQALIGTRIKIILESQF